ncbi:MAG: LysE family transporter [Flavobacteriales bacterium]
MSTALFFLVAMAASFIGSLQAGVVNTAVLAHTVKWGRAAGRRMAVGGSIPEFIYGAVAFAGAGRLVDALGIGAAGITLVVASILVALGLYFVLFFRPRQAHPGEDKLTGDLRRGMVLGLANPQLVLFWCGVKLGLVSLGVRGEGPLDLIAFALGAFAGALALLLILVRLGHHAQARLSPPGMRRLFRYVGMVLLGFGLLGLWRGIAKLP